MDPSVVKLEVRGNVGPEFKAEDEILLATVLPAGPHTWTGPLGLEAVSKVRTHGSPQVTLRDNAP